MQNILGPRRAVYFLVIKTSRTRPNGEPSKSDAEGTIYRLALSEPAKPGRRLSDEGR
jgi:hypothetical protein